MKGEIPAHIVARYQANGNEGYNYCPVGWLPLLIELDAKLNELVPAYTIAQIKEKFAGLRFYADIPLHGDGTKTKQAQDLIDEYENKSYTICDTCGEAGKEHNINGWMATRCNAHSKPKEK